MPVSVRVRVRVRVWVRVRVRVRFRVSSYDSLWHGGLFEQSCSCHTPQAILG